MTCTEKTAELVECARARREPRPGLRAHLTECARCAERWDAELRLTDGFQKIRREMQQFNLQKHPPPLLQQHFALPQARPQRDWFHRGWIAALCIAVALMATISVGIRMEHSRGRQRAAVDLPLIEARSMPPIYENSSDASALSADEFIAVPYSPPLARGEIVRVVHTDLQPEVLAGMGIRTEPGWAFGTALDIPADVVVGEDGIPRAIRLTEAAQPEAN